MTTPLDLDAIWVVSDVTPNGSYIVAVQYGPDTAIPLDRDRAVRYALAVTVAAARAEYDAAVLAQGAAMGFDQQLAAQPVLDLRRSRPPLDTDATAPLMFEPVVRSKDRSPVVRVHLAGRPVSDWSPNDARGHVLHVLDVLAGVDLDAAYHAYLIGIGVEDGKARAVVHDIANHRPTDVGDE